MRKLSIMSSLLALCLSSANVLAIQPLSLPDDNPVTFSLASMPNGLVDGTFSIHLRNWAVNFDASGPVMNVGNYGLVGSLNELNDFIHNSTINGQHMYYFGVDLQIQLVCKNNARVRYQYDATFVRTKGQVSLQPPADCA